MRTDISKWVVHFVHDRNLDYDPHELYDEHLHIPIAFSDDLTPMCTDWEYYDDDYPIEADADAFSVLHKILDDGHLRVSWAFRNGRPTIYGPRGAVCFTEMPLSALIDYARSRGDTGAVNLYGIAVLKHELFAVGGRPVIYGVTSRHQEIPQADGEVMPRILDGSCGISPAEQYRYVAMNLSRDPVIDWSHEREWRWTAPIEQLHEIPGLPLWLSNQYVNFSRIIIIVQEVEEMRIFVDKMKEYYDSGGNNYDFQFDRQLLQNTKLVAIEEVQRMLAANSQIRVEDLPIHELLEITAVEPSEDTIQRVRAALVEANAAARRAVEEFRRNRELYGYFGYATVVTYESHTEITEALMRLEAVHPIGGLGYRLYGVTREANTGGLLDLEEVAARAAAGTLTEILQQQFLVESRPD